MRRPLAARRLPWESLARPIHRNSLDDSWQSICQTRDRFLVNGNVEPLNNIRPDAISSGATNSPGADYLVFPCLGCFVGGALGGVVLIVMGGTSSVPSGVRTDVATITQSPP